MRKYKKILAVICLLACMTALCACGKQETPVLPVNPKPAAPSENGIADEADKTYSGDRLAKVLNVENGICGFEYYDGDAIGDYAKIDVAEYTPTGERDGVSLGEVKLYNAAGGRWDDAAVEDFSSGMFVVITADENSGKIIWVSIVG